MLCCLSELPGRKEEHGAGEGRMADFERSVPEDIISGGC